MKLFLFSLLLLMAINLQSQNSKETLKVVEQYPVCLNCSHDIKSFIDPRLNNLVIKHNDSIIACFEIDSLTRINNIEIYNSNNTELNNIIHEAIQSTQNWVPAFNRGKPTTINICFRISIQKQNKEFKSENFGLASTDFDDFTSVRMERFYWEYFKTNSTESISHLDVSKINGYTTFMFDGYKNKGLHKSKHFKTKKLEISDSGEKIRWTLFVPKFKIYATNEYGYKTLEIENVPVDHEVILFMAKNEGDNVYISFEKFNYKGERRYNPKFEEYTFSQLNKKIESYINE